jgi:hypothetical protein
MDATRSKAEGGRNLAVYHPRTTVGAGRSETLLDRVFIQEVRRLEVTHGSRGA